MTAPERLELDRRGAEEAANVIYDEIRAGGGTVGIGNPPRIIAEHAITAYLTAAPQSSEGRERKCADCGTNDALRPWDESAGLCLTCINSHTEAVLNRVATLEAALKLILGWAGNRHNASARDWQDALSDIARVAASALGGQPDEKEET